MTDAEAQTILRSIDDAAKRTAHLTIGEKYAFLRATPRPRLECEVWPDEILLRWKGRIRAQYTGVGVGVVYRLFAWLRS